MLLRIKLFESINLTRIKLYYNNNGQNCVTKYSFFRYASIKVYRIMSLNFEVQLIVPAIRALRIRRQHFFSVVSIFFPSSAFFFRRRHFFSVVRIFFDFLSRTYQFTLGFTQLGLARISPMHQILKFILVVSGVLFFWCNVLPVFVGDESPEFSQLATPP